MAGSRRTGPGVSVCDQATRARFAGRTPHRSFFWWRGVPKAGIVEKVLDVGPTPEGIMKRFNAASFAYLHGPLNPARMK